MRGRIVKGVGGLYTIDTEKGFYKGNARGKFRLENTKPLIGDFVDISILSELEKECLIEKIYERKNMLIRPSVSNVDQVFIVFSITSPKINLDLLDRFIVIAESKSLEINICINKVELVSNKEFIKIKEKYSSFYNIISVSTYENIGISKILELCKDKVSVFAGPSGVGKSSIINLINPKANMEIGEISNKIKRGKHTTRHVELHNIADHGYIIDSPGFTSLHFENVDKNLLQNYFREFNNFKNNCKFNDCIHKNENSCAVKDEVGKSIMEERYKRYIKFLNELEDERGN